MKPAREKAKSGLIISGLILLLIFLSEIQQNLTMWNNGFTFCLKKLLITLLHKNPTPKIIICLVEAHYTKLEQKVPA